MRAAAGTPAPGALCDVATRVRDDGPRAPAMHNLAHSTNLVVE